MDVSHVGLRKDTAYFQTKGFPTRIKEVDDCQTNGDIGAFMNQ